MKEKKYPMYFIVLALFFFANTFIIQADIISEHYSLIKKKHYKKRYYKRHRRHKRHKTVILSDSKKLQIALQYLGIYYGKINGDMNSFDTHNAIQQFQKSHQVSPTGLVNQTLKDYLFYIYNVSILAKYLDYHGKDKIFNGKKYQAALKIHGVYPNKIDGIMGNATKKAFLAYKQKTALDSKNPTLSHEEKIILVNSAKALLKEQQTDFHSEKNTKILETERDELSDYNRSIPLKITSFTKMLIQNTKEITDR